MDTPLVWAGEDPDTHPTTEIGGKGRNLLWLYQKQNKDFTVPKFVIVPTSRYRKYVKEKGIEDLVNNITLQEVQDMYNEEGDYMPIFPPVQISSLFVDFLQSNPDVREAIRTITGRNNWKEARDTFTAAFPEFDNQYNNTRSFEEYQELLSTYTKKHSEFSSLHKQLKNAEKNIRNYIIRSNSPLEDTINGYEGVFKSSSKQDWNRDADHWTSKVLTSQFRSYALFWMNEFEDTNTEMSIIIQQYAEKTEDNVSYEHKYIGFLNLDKDRVIHLGKPEHKHIGQRINLDKGGVLPKDTPLASLKKLLDAGDYLRESFQTKNISLEFVLGENKPYIVQIRNLPEQTYHAKKLPANTRLLTDKITGDQVGTWRGTAVNLTNTKINKEDLKAIDETYKQAIYLITVSDFIKLGSEGEEFTRLTPNKTGVILCGEDWKYNHIDMLYQRGMKLFASTRRKENEQELLKTQTGESLYVRKERTGQGEVYLLN